MTEIQQPIVDEQEIPVQFVSLEPVIQDEKPKTDDQVKRESEITPTGKHSDWGIK